MVHPSNYILKCFIIGDENSSIITTIDGYPLIENNGHRIDYATIDSVGIIHSTGIVAKNITDRSIEDVNLLKTIDKKSISKIKNSHTRLFSKKAGDLSYSLTSFPKTGNRNLLVILIDFTDQLFQIGNNNFNNLMNQASYNGTGSFRDYWLQSSYNGLTVNSTINGWYHAGHNMAYYGANSNGSDINPRLLVQEAVDAAENAGVNFSTYDNDKDGKVDGVIVIHAGYGEEAGGGANTIWSHHWTLDSYKRTYDGVIIDDYAIVPELRNNFGSNISNIGVICHEFGHSLGLPDLYDTDISNGNSEGIGEWGLMGSGNWNNNGASPSILCAWSKIFLNWATPSILSSECSLLLPNSVQNNIIYQINTPHTNEYFLIENRQRIGFDAGLPGTGLSIWHINTSKTTGVHISANDVNADEALKGVDLEEADGISALDNNTNRGDGGDLFPGNTCNRLFNDSSTPNSQTYSPIVNSSKPITNIMESGSNIRFDFMGFVPISGPSVVCTSGVKFSVINPGATVEWRATSTNNNLTIDSSTGAAYATNSTPGEGTISAIIHATGCGDITLPPKRVWVGMVDPARIVSSREGQAVGAWAQYHILCKSGTTLAAAGYDSDGDGEPMGDSGYPSSQSITGYQWSFPSGWSYSSTGVGKPNEHIGISCSTYPAPPLGQMVQVGVRAQNDCGWTNWKYDYWQVVSCSGGILLKISPNPTESEATLALESEDVDVIDKNLEWEYEIYSPGLLLKEKKTKLKERNTKINTSGWKDGVYIVKAKVGNELLSEKLVVKH